MNARTTCPEPAALEALLHGVLPAADEGPLSAHLEGCDRCQGALQELVASGASWASLPRSLGQTPPPEAALEQALGRIAAPTRSAETLPEADGDGELSLSFLDPPVGPGHLGRLEDYEILGVLGRGGMGLVFKAADPSLGRVVAVKVMAPQLACLPSARQRFLREARAAAAVSHENVVTIHAVGEAKGLPYLVMQYIEGPSLEQRLAGGPLPVAEVLRIAAATACGLEAAHARGLVHRDVKPANILLEAGTGRVRLTDFGLARAVDDASLTQSGVVAGTPQYMAPEQARGEAVDHRADLFSLGSVMYAVCTGRPPFEAGPPLVVLRRVSDERPRPVREINPEVPRWLEAIIARLHAPAPADRFPSADELADLLDRHLAQFERSAAIPEAVPVVVPAAPAPRKRSRLPLVLALAAVLLLAFLGAAATVTGLILYRRGALPEAHDPGTRVADEKPDGAPTAEGERELAEQARQVLATHCYRCHGENGSVEGGFNYLMDRDQLISRKKVRPDQPDQSRLLRRVVEGEMPPEDEKPRPDKDEIDVLRRWVAAGAPAFGPSPALRTFISPAEVARAMRDDLDRRKERDRRFTRYFTLTHLLNAGLSEDELQTYRNGLSKLLNSLSWKKDVVVPVPVDAARTVLRIDLRDYGWTDAEWDTLTTAYPYGGDNGAAPANVRGDWFVATASRPPLYHQLLQLPNRERELEKLLHINAEGDIAAERVARAGFNDSGVSRNNRLIERHETPYGACWKSYDFAENTGAQNLFERPLGPGSDNRSFRHAGGEIIFNLPNGLQGYMLVNGKGERIDKGPTDIVSDPKRPDRAVENGLSCMSCHSRGLNPKSDQIRAHVLANKNAFPKEEMETILALYPPANRFAELLRKDTERFEAAAAATGAKVGATEPVMALAAQFEAPLDLRRAAAEIGLRPDDFLARLERSSEIGRAIGALRVPGGTVQRQTFVGVFSDMVSAWSLDSSPVGVPPEGEVYALGEGHPFPPYLVGADAGVSLKDGFRLKSQHYVHTRASNYLAKDFVFELTFDIDPGADILVVGIGDQYQPLNGPSRISWRIHPPHVNKGWTAFAKTGAGEEGIGRITHTGTYLLRIEKKGKALKFSVRTKSKGVFETVMTRTTPDVHSFAPFLNQHNAFIYLGNGSKLKAVRLTESTPGRVQPVTLPPVTTRPADPVKSPRIERAAPVAFKPHLPAAESEVVTLPGAVTDVAVGGGGRYLVFRLEKSLAVFDAQEGKVVRQLPLAEEHAHFAAGATRLVVLYPGTRVLQVWDLTRFVKERSSSFPGSMATGEIRQVCMGSASNGPLFVYLENEKRTLALNPATLETTEVGWRHWGPRNAYGPLHMRAAPDGDMLVGWSGGWSGAEMAFFREGIQHGSDDKIEFSDGLFALPSADGRRLFTPWAIVNRDGGPIKPPGLENTYRVPAHESGFFIALHSQGQYPFASREKGPTARLPAVSQAVVHTEDGRRLFPLAGIDGSNAGTGLLWERRIHYYPRAGLLAVLIAPDRLLLRRVDLVKNLDKTGADYIVVVSQPPLAHPGSTWSYQLDVRAKAGAGKVTLEAGPDGLTVTPAGRMTWRVPDDYPNPAAAVKLTLRDAKGQEMLQQFSVIVAPAKH